MTEPTTLAICMAVDGDGDYGVGRDAEEASGDYQNNHGDIRQSLRVVHLNVTLTLPEDGEANVTVPDEAGQTVTAEVA